MPTVLAVLAVGISGYGCQWLALVVFLNVLAVLAAAAGLQSPVVFKFWGRAAGA